MTDAALIAWLRTVDGHLSAVSTKLDSKADKADVVELTRQVSSLRARVRDDEVKETVIGRRRRAFRDSVKWILGLGAVVGAGALGAVLH